MKQKQHAIFPVASRVLSFGVVFRHHGWSDDGHVFRDQWAERRTAYFLQLWTHSWFSGFCWEALRCAVMLLLLLNFPFYKQKREIGSAILHHLMT